MTDWHPPTYNEVYGVSDDALIVALCGRTVRADMLVVDPDGLCGCDGCRETRWRNGESRVAYFARFADVTPEFINMMAEKDGVH